MAYADEAALLFKIKADSSQAVGEISKFRGVVQREMDGITRDLTSQAGAFGRVAASLGPVGLAVGIVTGATVAGAAALFELAASASKAADQYYNLSQKVNFSAHTLSAMDAAASQSGVEFGSLSAALGIFDKKLEAAIEKPTKLGRVLKANNVDIHDNQKALEGMFTILSKLPEGATQTALAMEAFGRGGKEMLAVVKQAHGDLPTLIRLLDEMGATISDKDAKAAHEFDEKMELLSKQFDAAKVKVADELLPVLGKLFDDLSGWLSRNEGELRSWGTTFANTAQTIIDWAGRIAKAYNSIRTITPPDDGKHPTPPSNWDRAWDWVGSKLDGGIDTSQWEAGTGRGTTHMMTPDEIAAQARAAGGGQGADAAAMRRAQEQVSKALAGSSGGSRHRGGGSANKAAHIEEKEIQNEERDESDRHNQFTEELRRAYTRRIYDLDEYVRQTKEELDKHYSALVDDYDKEEALIRRTVKSKAEQHEKLGEVERKRKQALHQYEKDTTAIEDEEADKRHAAALARSKALAGVDDATDRQRIAAIQATADLGIARESDAAQRIGDIQLRMHDRAVNLLRDRLAEEEKGSAAFRTIQGEIAAAEVDRAALAEDVAHRVEMAKRAEVEAERQRLEQLRQLRAQATLEGLNIERREVEDAANEDPYRTRRERLATIRQLADLERQTEEEQHRERLQAIEDLKADNLKRAVTEAERVEALKAYHAQLENEERRHQLTLGETTQSQKEGEDKENPFQPLKDLWKDFKDGSQNANDSIGNSVAVMSKTVVGSLKNMEGALRQGIVANLLYGESLGKALKKALAEQLAEISAEATIQGLKHAAWALGSLAFGDFSGAAKHAAASAAFFALAAATGVGASKLAQSAGLRGAGSGTAEGNAVASTGTTQPRGFVEGRTGGSPDPRTPQFHIILETHTRNEPGTLTEHIVKIIGSDGRAREAVVGAVHREYIDNGRIRSVMRADLLGEAVAG
jgi:hypothetical protein